MHRLYSVHLHRLDSLFRAQKFPWIPYSQPRSWRRPHSSAPRPNTWICRTISCCAKDGSSRRIAWSNGRGGSRAKMWRWWLTQLLWLLNELFRLWKSLMWRVALFRRGVDLIKLCQFFYFFTPRHLHRNASDLQWVTHVPCIWKYFHNSRWGSSDNVGKRPVACGIIWNNFVSISTLDFNAFRQLTAGRTRTAGNFKSNIL